MVGTVHIADAQTAQRDNGRRSEQRREMCTQAELYIFDHSGRPRRMSDVLTRNSSFRGLALVVRLEEPVRPGQALEVVLGTSDQVQEHLAGTVAFCRSLGTGYYEVGMRVMAGGEHSILAYDMACAKALYDWFAGALDRG